MEISPLLKCTRIIFFLFYLCKDLTFVISNCKALSDLNDAKPVYSSFEVKCSILPRAKTLIAKGYDVETMIIHFNIDHFQVKAKEFTIVSTSLFAPVPQKIGTTLRAELPIFN